MSVGACLISKSTSASSVIGKERAGQAETSQAEVSKPRPASRGQQAETRQAEGASRLGCLVAGVGCRLLWVATAGQRLLQHATDLPELSNGTLLSRKQIV